MKLNNSIKLSMANFSLFWKILIYKAVAIGLGILLFLPVLKIVNGALDSAGFYMQLKQFLTGSVFQNVSITMASLYSVAKALFLGVSYLISSNALVFAYLIIIIFIVVPFLLKMSDVPTSECIYGYMSSLNKNTFMVNFTDGFNKSAGYSILSTLLELPFYAILLFGSYGILGLSSMNFNLQILCPIIFFIFVIFVVGFKLAALSGWAPSMVAFNKCATKAFGKGIHAVKRRFLSALSSFVVLVSVFMAAIYLFGFYALIAIVPFSALITSIFGQVMFFESQGMNYYITPENIIKPRKLEEADSIKKIKNII